MNCVTSVSGAFVAQHLAGRFVFCFEIAGCSFSSVCMCAITRTPGADFNQSCWHLACMTWERVCVTMATMEN